ncbi:MAG TPA: endonuclease MutS2, partial [Acholeplasmataceae bacterium]|nr:endonuclease MutS2 [Acholeplasmataceae bacterium]
MNKYYKILEFDKIIALVKQYARLPQTQSNLENIKIYNEIEEIQKALDEVDEATILIQRMGSFPLLFHTDISFYLNKVHKYGVLTEEELLEVGNLLDSIKENYLYLDKLDSAEIKVEHFNHKVLSMTYFKDLNLKIKKIITPFGEIKDDASSLLKDLRRKQKDIETSIQKKLQEILNKNQKKLTQNIVSIRNDRFVIPVRVEYKNTFSGIIHDQSASGETVFIEPTIINSLQNQLNQIREEEKQEIYRILKQISLEINNYYDDLMHAYQIFVELDTIFAKAKYAIKIGAQKPQVNNEGIVDLVNCRHPLLNVDNVVSNNINIGTYKGIIITGPNTGGKTVLLKTIGLLAIMVKAGMLIPCDESSNIMIFDNVFADIGDEQSIDQNLSTFSSHLKNIIQIINNVTNESLVLLDELGSGTDPSEGTSLAISIFDYLIKKDCLVIATSHYSELKIYAYNSNDVINASVEFDEKTLKPTYKLLMGVPGMSNAL